MTARPSADCAYPGDTEHDHDMCIDAVTDAVADELTPRQKVIAAIRQAATYLEEHPEFPAPVSVVMSHYTRESDEVDEKTRCEGVVRWGRANGAWLSETSGGVTAIVTLATGVLHGAQVEYRRYAFFDERPRRSYVEKGGKS